MDSLIQLLRHWVLRFRGALAASKDEDRHYHFASAHKFALLYEPEQFSEKEIHELVSKLKEDQKHVDLLVYINGSDRPTREPSTKTTVLAKKDLNWLQFPKNAAVHSFLDTEYDAVINLSSEESFPLNYLMMVAKSNLKVGCIDQQTQPQYDLMIRAGQQYSREDFINHLQRTLKTIEK